MGGWCRPVVPRSVCYVGGMLAYIVFPSNSFLCPCYMVLTVSMSRLLCHTHVCCLIYALRMLKLDCWF